jgi:hypothetical protein
VELPLLPTDKEGSALFRQIFDANFPKIDPIAMSEESDVALGTPNSWMVLTVEGLGSAGGVEVGVNDHTAVQDHFDTAVFDSDLL